MIKYICVVVFFSTLLGWKHNNADARYCFKIQGMNIVPKSSFALNSIVNSSGDTLYLVTCSKYVYYPFGDIKSEVDLKSSFLGGFSITTKKDDAKTELEILKLHTNKLILSFDGDTTNTMTSYIVQGEINERGVNFINGIEIGITKADFFKRFFTFFPKKLESKYKTVIFESCVTGIKHVYSFDDNKLHSVTFNCIDCVWKAE